MKNTLLNNINDRFDLLIFENAQQMIDRRSEEAKNRGKKLTEIEKIGECEGFEGKCEGFEGKCGNRKDVKWTPSRTFYPWNIDKEPLENPNRNIFLCGECEIGYNEYWDEMWNEYYAGRL